ncbi:hydantoinase/oxoprolinase family protein [Frondihabitans sucicola]|uniref:hydantoinase/oxoprolinase family protein n=1 Tax=Frondihabitans sucicola TaxID=1268041 RepID=UPI0025722BFC|nr:hydantoinase/oxoprolinase family protein [Frondihabitans sucicola]
MTHVGPRSAHIAGLPYACYAEPGQLGGARLVQVAPLEGDPADYVAIEAAGGRFAVTMTCAANALGLVPETDYARADPATSRLALQPLADAIGVDVETAARQVLAAGAGPVLAVVEKMIDDYRLPDESAVLIGGGGGAASVTPFVGASRSTTGGSRSTARSSARSASPSP